MRVRGSLFGKARSSAVAAVLLAAVLALFLVACGDSDETGSSSEEAPAAEETAAEETAAEPKDLDAVGTNLEAAGYTVKSAEPEPLIRRDDGGIVQPEEKIDVTGGDLTGDGASVYALGSSKDVAALEAFAGGDVSLVRGDYFFQSSAPGDAQRVADASGLAE